MACNFVSGLAPTFINYMLNSQVTAKQLCQLFLPLSGVEAHLSLRKSQPRNLVNIDTVYGPLY